MPTCRPREFQQSTGIRCGVPSSCRLIELAAQRLVVGADVAAAKFASGKRIDDPTREREILNWVADRLNAAGPRHEICVAFFRDQMAASKVVQRGLHARWRDHPQECPPRRRDLTAEIRPDLDAINEEMLSLLAGTEDLPSLRQGHCAGLFDRVLSASPALAPLRGLRQAAERVALRSLRAAGDARR
jgi:chorismate mutase